MMAKIERFTDRAVAVWFWCGLIIAILTWMFEPMTLWYIVLCVVAGPLALIIIAFMFIGTLFV
ncbi:hypothetical protein GCM10008915_36730 [Bifidobacterium pullorum subsp. gallinarum]